MANRECSKVSLKFVTGNQGKIKEMQAIVGDTVFVESIMIDLPELFDVTLDDIAKAKVRYAFEEIGKPVIIEATSLCFESIGGLPGPNVKSLSNKLGNEGLVEILNFFPDKSANALCVFAYWDGVMESPILFKGSTSGEIVTPKGNSGFGWDPIFKDIDSGLTFGQMDADQKNLISHRRKALDKLKVYFAMSDKGPEAVFKSDLVASRPLFVVFEGPDRAGKSTQIQILRDYFNAIDVNIATMRDPDYTTPFGPVLEAHLTKKCRLSEKEARVYFAHGRRYLQGQLLEHLQNGSMVLYDRYAYCGIACGLAKAKLNTGTNKGPNSITEQWLKGLDRGLIKPDVVLYFKLHPEVAAKRDDYGAQEYEKLEFQRLYISEFDNHAEEWDFTFIDAEKEKEHVTKEILCILEKAALRAAMTNASRGQLFSAD